MGTPLSPPVSLGLLLAAGPFFLTQKPWCTGTNQATLGGVEDRVWQRDAMSHHGPIETILRHHAATTPALLPLPPLGPPVLKPDLIWGRTGSRRAYRRRHSKEDASRCPWAGSSKRANYPLKSQTFEELYLLLTQNSKGLIIVGLMCSFHWGFPENEKRQK